MTHTSWPIQLTRQIGAEVRGHRTRREMTVQALADRCSDLGLPLSRVTLTKMERGLREHIAVPELLILGAALDVAPLELLFPSATHLPDGLQHQREVLPGRFTPQPEAARWFTGIVDDALLGEVRAQVKTLARLVGIKGD